jgi:retinol dehydrogenase-12
MDINDLHYKKGRKYSEWGAYGQSKLANILFAKGLNERLKGTQITAVSLHPGMCNFVM